MKVIIVRIKYLIFVLENQVLHANLEAFGWIRNQCDAELMGGSLITADDETSIDISSDASLKIRRIPDQVSPRILNQCAK